MSDIRVRVELPAEPPKPSPIDAAALGAIVGSELRRVAEAYPITELWIVISHVGQNYFDLRDPAGKKKMSRVPADDPRAYTYLAADDVVVVGFRDRNRGRPHIKGRSVGRSPGDAKAIRFWCQSESTHLRNNVAAEPCRLPSFGDSSVIYTYSSKVGGLHDSRGRAYGLVSFMDGGAPYLGVAYPVFNSGGTALDHHQLDVITLDGSVSFSYQWDSTETTILGNFSSDQLFLDSTNIHFWLTPSHFSGQKQLRAWSKKKSSADAGKDNIFVSVAFNNVLYPAFSTSYSGGENRQGEPPEYWPPDITPLVETITGSIKGISRDDSETITPEFNLSPASLASLTNSILSSSIGPGTGWPANPGGTSWTVAISERELLDGTVAENAAMGHGYAEYTPWTTPGVPVSQDTRLRDFTKKLQITLCEIDAADGHRLWIAKITKTPAAPIESTLMGPFEDYMASPFGLGPADGVTAIEGRVSAGLLPDSQVDAFGQHVQDIYPGRRGTPGTPDFLGVAFNWPQFEYFGASNMRLMPHVANDGLAIPPSEETSSFYSGCKNNLDLFTQFGVSESGCGPGLFRDTDGNIYLSFIFPRGFLKQGRIYSRYEFPVGEDPEIYQSHLPAMDWAWECRQRSYSSEGKLRWERDLTQWLEATWWGHTGADYGFDFVIGGSGGALPLSDNVYWQVPVGKFLLTIRDVHTIGASYRPDMCLEVVDSSSGELLQFMSLLDSEDTYVYDVRRDTETGELSDYGALVAYAGEHIWQVTNTRIKAAIDSSGIPWALIYMQHSTRDPMDGISAYDQIYLIQAPTDKSVGPWTPIMLWDPGSDDHPAGTDWESVVISDGALYWNHWDGSAWKVYKKAL